MGISFFAGLVNIYTVLFQKNIILRLFLRLASLLIQKYESIFFSLRSQGIKLQKYVKIIQT